MLDPQMIKEACKLADQYPDLSVVLLMRKFKINVNYAVNLREYVLKEKLKESALIRDVKEK